jgi:hypothetical protein
MRAPGGGQQWKILVALAMEGPGRVLCPCLDAYSFWFYQRMQFYPQVFLSRTFVPVKSFWRGISSAANTKAVISSFPLFLRIC